MGALDDLRNAIRGFDAVPRCGDSPQISLSTAVRLLRDIYERYPSPVVMRAIIYGSGLEAYNYLIKMYNEILADYPETEQTYKEQLISWKKGVDHLRDRSISDLAELDAVMNVWGIDMAKWPKWLQEDITGPDSIYDRWFVSGGSKLQYPLLNYPWMFYNQICTFYNVTKDDPTHFVAVALQQSADDLDKAAGEVYEDGVQFIEDTAKKIAEKTIEILEKALLAAGKGAFKGGPILVVALVAGGAYFLLRKTQTRSTPVEGAS